MRYIQQLMSCFSTQLAITAHLFPYYAMTMGVFVGRCVCVCFYLVDTAGVPPQCQPCLGTTAPLEMTPSATPIPFSPGVVLSLYLQSLLNDFISHITHWQLIRLFFFLSVCRGHSRFSMMDDESVQSSILSRPSAKSIYCEFTWLLNWCQTVSNMEMK